MSHRLIFDNPALQSRSQRYLYGGLTVALWALWVYLWLPLISLVAWWLGFKLFYKEMIEQGGFEALLVLSGWYGLTIFVLGGSLGLWALYNLWRFRGKERRTHVPHVEPEALAEFFHVDAVQLSVWQQANRVVVFHDEEGKIQAVSTAEASLPKRGRAAGSPQVAAPRPVSAE